MPLVSSVVERPITKTEILRQTKSNNLLYSKALKIKLCFAIVENITKAVLIDFSTTVEARELVGSFNKLPSFFT